MVIVVLALLAPVSAASAVMSSTEPIPGTVGGGASMPKLIDLTFSSMPLAIGSMVVLKDGTERIGPPVKSKA